MVSSTPILPVSTEESQPYISSSSLKSIRSFLTRLTCSLRQAFSLRRPWSELVDRTSFSRPISLTEAASRMRKNSSYFKLNYILILSLVLALSLLTHPFSLLIILSLLSSWIFLYVFRPSEQPLVVFGRNFTSRETLAILLLLTLIVLFLTTVGSLLISASLVGLGIVGSHAAFRVPEDLFLDDQDTVNVGFLSMLTGVATSAAASAAIPSV